MHIIDEVDGPVFVYEPGEYQSGQKGFAGTGPTENTVTALDKTFQIHANRRLHIERLPDMKVRRVAFVMAEDTVDVFLFRFADNREMDRNGFDQMRFSAVGDGFIFFHHQQRPQAHGAVRGGAVQHLTDQVVLFTGGICEDLGIGGVEAHIGYHAEKPALFPFNHDEFACTDIFNGIPLVEFHFQTTNE